MTVLRLPVLGIFLELVSEIWLDLYGTPEFSPWLYSLHINCLFTALELGTNFDISFDTLETRIAGCRRVAFQKIARISTCHPIHIN